MRCWISMRSIGVSGRNCVLVCAAPLRLAAASTVAMTRIREIRMVVSSARGGPGRLADVARRAALVRDELPAFEAPAGLRLRVGVFEMAAGEHRARLVVLADRDHHRVDTA